MNWKCICGVVNFATDANCKRCQTVRPLTQGMAQPITEFTEHSAPDGDAASGILKAIGIGALICGFGLAFFAVRNSTAATENYSNMLAILFCIQGVMMFALFVGFGIMLDNVVAIRKNSQHLAGIRATATNQQQQNTWQ
jgi:hypothetical protein